MNSLEKFEYFIKAKLLPLLKSKGFKKSNLTWNKKFYDLIQVVNIQKSIHNSSNLIDFTVNLGVFSASTFEIIWDKTPSKIIKESDCLVRSRIGPIQQNNFTGSAIDQWWRIENTTDIKELSFDFLTNFENCVFLFLDTFKTIEDISDFFFKLKNWESQLPLQVLYMSVIAYQLGKIEDAKNMLFELMKKHEDLKKRCSIVAKNMGLQLDCPAHQKRAGC